jgi:hypothetical protein
MDCHLGHIQILVPINANATDVTLAKQIHISLNTWILAKY